MRTITVTRYVTPLREGGSLPAVVEADDEGLYVLKFRGAGQGPKALVAELVAGELARALGLPVPEIVLAELDPELARTEPDPEIQDLVRASAGTNLALDYLPGSMGFDPAVDRVTAEFASHLVWFDAFTCNVDRTARNTNLLLWHRQPWLIDHGAALYFHHGWDGSLVGAASRFPIIRDHVLLPAASALADADAALAPRVTPARVQAILGDIPDTWLGSDSPALATPDAVRAAASSRRHCMHAHDTYDYAVIRVVPRVERGEFVNVGVVLSCERTHFLAARFALDPARLLALDPGLDLDTVQRHLDGFASICAGAADAGPIARLPQRARFHWLTAPRSAIIQTSPAHAGRCADPEAALAHLLATMVEPPRADSPN